MIVYGVKYENHTCLWDNLEDALEEARNLLKYGNIGDEISITTKEIPEKEYISLKEFEGY